jgi:hypothetical protein
MITDGNALLPQESWHGLCSAIGRIISRRKKMKRIITVMMVITLVGGAAFARGTGDYTNGRPQGMGVQSGTTAGEDVTITGTVEDIDGQVVLKTEDATYSLSAPGFYRAGVEVPFGETIEVQGRKTEALADCDYDAEGHIFVGSARVNGEEVTFSNGRDSGNSYKSMDALRDNTGGDSPGRGNVGRNNSGRGNSSRGNSGRGNAGRNNTGRGNPERAGFDQHNNGWTGRR